MDKILEEAVNNIVEIFIIDVENVALAKGAVSKILKELVEEKTTSTNRKHTPCTHTQLQCRYHACLRPRGQCNGNVAVLD